VKHKPAAPTAWTMFITAVIGFGLVFSTGCQSSGDTDEQSSTQQSVNPAAQISFSNGQATLTIDQPTQQRMGIEVVSLMSTLTREQGTVPAVVLSAQDLATFRNGYVATQSQIEKDRVAIDPARKEYDRLKMLYDTNHSVSDKALQSAEANVRSLEADERAATQQLNLQASVVEQQWGKVVAKWAVDGSPDLERFLDMREVLLEVTLPFDPNYEALRTISVAIPGRTRSQASLLSPFPRVDPRIQGRSFLYAAPAQPDFTPGVSLVAYIPIGAQRRGVIVPATAVIWSEGNAWAYVQTAPNQFSRREVGTDAPVDGGYFTASGFVAGEKLVNRGAQSLFSEESLLQGGGGTASDEN
jgi:hypothetical protein